EDFAFDLKRVPRPRWLWPGELAAGADDTVGKRQTALDQKAHGDRRGMPAARHQAREQRVLGGVRIKMEGLRIELAGERCDLRGIDAMGSADEALSGFEIFEVKLAVRFARHVDDLLLGCAAPRER